MIDIVDQLRDRAYAGKGVDALCERAAEEIERLRTAIRRFADQDATLSVVNGSVIVQIDDPRQVSSQENSPACPHVTGTVTQYCTLTPFTLTDEERSAIVWCVEMAATTATECDEELAALRGLLDRLE